MTDRDDGNEWMWQAPAQPMPEVYVRVWHGDTAVAHYRADRGTARLYVDEMRGRLDGLRYTIDPLLSFAPPTRPLPVWHLGQATS